MRALATERTLTYMFSNVYVFVLCRIIMSICLSDLTESIINSFDCVRSSFHCERKRKCRQSRGGHWVTGEQGPVGGELTVTPGAHMASVSICALLWKSHSHLYITLFKRPNSVLFFFPCGTDYIWLITSKQEIEAHRICDMEINLIWFGFVHFYMRSMHVVTMTIFSPTSATVFFSAFNGTWILASKVFRQEMA